jgi:hypothetical protein
MYNLSLFISGLLSLILNPPQNRVRVETEERLDPRGLVHHDLQYLRTLMPEPGWAKGKTLEEVAYEQGQLDLIKVIESRVIGRRLDGQPTRIN